MVRSRHGDSPKLCEVGITVVLHQMKSTLLRLSMEFTTRFFRVPNENPVDGHTLEQ